MEVVDESKNVNGDFAHGSVLQIAAAVQGAVAADAVAELALGAGLGVVPGAPPI